MRLARQLLTIVFVLSFPILVGFGPPKLVESDSERVPVYATQLPSIESDAVPIVEARASVIMDASTGLLVYQQNATKHMAPASITKIITATVALQRGNLKDKVTIAPDMLEEGSTMGLLPGDVVTLEDLLWGMMLPSGNDAATAIAAHVGGSVSEFVGLMNAKADELGLADTHFVNPHGLDDEGHYSSALDIAKMGRYALGIPKFAEIVGTRFRQVHASRDFPLLNNNRLLGNTDLAASVDGVKTGFTDNAGDSLVVSAVKDGRRVIVVVMGTSGRDKAASALVTYAFSSFGWMNMDSPFSRYVLNTHEGGQAAGSIAPAVMLPRWQALYPALYVSAHQMVPAFPFPKEVARRDGAGVPEGGGASR